MKINGGYDGIWMMEPNIVGFEHNGMPVLELPAFLEELEKLMDSEGANALVPCDARGAVLVRSNNNTPNPYDRNDVLGHYKGAGPILLVENFRVIPDGTFDYTEIDLAHPGIKKVRL